MVGFGNGYWLHEHAWARNPSPFELNLGTPDCRVAQRHRVTQRHRTPSGPSASLPGWVSLPSSLGQEN